MTREQELQNENKELKQMISDLQYQLGEYKKTIEEKFEIPNDDDFMNDPEFLSMMSKMDEADDETNNASFYLAYLKEFYSHDAAMPFKVALDHTILEIPTYDGFTIKAPDEDNKDAYLFTMQQGMINRHNDLVDWAYNLSEDDLYPLHCYDNENVKDEFAHLKKCMLDRKFEITHHHIVEYADFWMFCFYHPEASIWAFRYNGLREDDTPEFYFSPEGESCVYRILDQTEMVNQGTLETESFVGKMIKNPMENPNMELHIFTNNDWKNY